MRDDRERLADILELIIGEAASQLSGELRKRSPEVPWRVIVGLRNRLVHAYFQADLALVWSVAANDLPSLRQTVVHLIDEGS